MLCTVDCATVDGGSSHLMSVQRDGDGVAKNVSVAVQHGSLGRPLQHHVAAIRVPELQTSASSCKLKVGLRYTRLQ